MKKIELTKGKCALVDNADFLDLSEYKWRVNETKIGFYAVRKMRVSEAGYKKGLTVLMHRQILGLSKEQIVDHINHDTLDNRRENLLATTYSGNNKNRKLFSNNRSGLSGVGLHKRSGKWRAYSSLDGKHIHLGLFGTLAEATDARTKSN